jgi:hypothetical protein
VSVGGVLSPHLWCLVLDDLIARLSGSGIYIFKGTKMTYLAVGKIPNMISGLM